MKIRGKIATIAMILVAALMAAENTEAAKTEQPGAAAQKKSVLYVLAHQDDEICIAARMKADVLAGNKITVIWITNGDKAGDPAERKKESRTAMEFLGVPEAGLHFLGFEDTFSYKTIPEAYVKALEAAKAAAPDEIFSNAWEGGNIDHDTAHFIAHNISLALENHPPQYEFPLYNAYRGTYQVSKFIPRENTETLATELNDEMAAAKVGIIKFYPSQKAILLPLSKLVSKKRLKKQGEPYRLVPEYNYLEPPTEGTLGYELGQNKTPHTFSEFREAVEKFHDSPVCPEKPPGKAPAGSTE